MGDFALLDRFRLDDKVAIVTGSRRGLGQGMAIGLAEAALDAFVAEPPIGSPLWGLENVVLTPHIGAHSNEAIERVGVLAAQNVLQALQTGEPIHRVA